VTCHLHTHQRAAAVVTPRGWGNTAAIKVKDLHALTRAAVRLRPFRPHRFQPVARWKCKEVRSRALLGAPAASTRTITAAQMNDKTDR